MLWFFLTHILLWGTFNRDIKSNVWLLDYPKLYNQPKATCLHPISMWRHQKEPFAQVQNFLSSASGVRRIPVYQLEFFLDFCAPDTNHTRKVSIDLLWMNIISKDVISYHYFHSLHATIEVLITKEEKKF